MTAIYSRFDSIEVMSARREECQLTLIEVLAKRSKHHPTSPKFWEEVEQFGFFCIPRLASLDHVRNVENYATLLKDTFECLDITIFKIPRLVNNIESYVTMLLREHFEGL